MRIVRGFLACALLLICAFSIPKRGLAEELLCGEKSSDEFYWDISLSQSAAKRDVEKQIRGDIAEYRANCDQFCSARDCAFFNSHHHHDDGDGVETGTIRELAQQSSAPININVGIGGAAWETVRWHCLCYFADVDPSEQPVSGEIEADGDGSLPVVLE